MQLSTKGRYAVMAMTELARREGARATPLAQIAQRQQISQAYLEQLFARLRRRGLVLSVRGPGGGYRLARPAGELSVADVVTAVDEPLRATRCAGEGGAVLPVMENPPALHEKVSALMNEAALGGGARAADQQRRGIGPPGGRAAAGSRVELLASLEDHRSAIVGTKRSVSFLLPHGLPSGAILLLSINGDWRDHRYLDPAHRLDRADFSWESGDSSLDLATLISTGEAAQLEFKREAPATSASKQTMLKTISAFANADGGTILIGVDDDGTMVGIRDAPAQKDRISNIINDSVHPAPIYDIECIHVENVDVLRVTTQPGPDAPYGVRLSGKTISYYVRRSGTTFPAEPNQVRAAVLARQQQPQGYLDRLLRR